MPPKKTAKMGQRSLRCLILLQFDVDHGSLWKESPTLRSRVSLARLGVLSRACSRADLPSKETCEDVLPQQLHQDLDQLPAGLGGGQFLYIPVNMVQLALVQLVPAVTRPMLSIWFKSSSSATVSGSHAFDAKNSCFKTSRTLQRHVSWRFSGF